MSTETAKINYAAHQIILNDRERLEIRGVTEVVSFDEQSVVLNTVCGGLSVEGSGLHVNDLSVEHRSTKVELEVLAVLEREQIKQTPDKELCELTRTMIEEGLK